MTSDGRGATVIWMTGRPAKGITATHFDYEAIRGLLLEPAGVDGSGRCVLCSIDPLTHEDHSALVTDAAQVAVLIVDGVFAFRTEINRYWDYRVWLSIDPELAVQRGTRRDQAWAGSAAETLHRDRYQGADVRISSRRSPSRRQASSSITRASSGPR
jgi:uridine kinase